MDLGHINYLNCLPLTYIMKRNLPQDIIVHAMVPAELNKAIMEGKLEVSPVSSIIYARNYKELKILPNVSITTNGKVESIILVSKVPMEKLGGKKVLLTAQSATSHCLLKIIGQKSYGVQPQYEVANIKVEDDYLAEAEAALFIGDNALYINNHRQENLYYYDLGEEWKKLTGLPMVYALWVTSRATKQGAKLKQINEFLVNGFKQGFQDLAKAIDSCDKLAIFSKEILWEYLHTIKWDLNEQELAGLKLFYAYAYELNLIPEEPTLDFV